MTAIKNARANWDSLIEQLEAGSIRGLTRMISHVENRENGWLDAMKRIYPKTGSANIIGITGSPGTGKSTLTNRIAQRLTERKMSVGIIAVDPSSPFSGGAILADRVRMSDASSLEGVFVRSMATHGALGGLSQSTRDVAKIMDAFGKQIIIIETVGVGQDEVDVIWAADLVLVVCVPGQGDSIQAIKAGVMEIADIFVVNKADNDEADQVVIDIESMLMLRPNSDARLPPVMKTAAIENEGLPELVDRIFDLLQSIKRPTEWQANRIRGELTGLLKAELSRRIEKDWRQSDSLDRCVEQVLTEEKDPYSVVQDVLDQLFTPS